MGWNGEAAQAKTNQQSINIMNDLIKKTRQSDTPRTDALMPDQVHKRTIYEHIVVMEAHSRQLERELAEAREDAANQRRLADMALAHRDVIIAERDKWKANHDNQVVINRTLRDRPDLGERAKLVDALTKQRDHYKAACDQYSEDEMLCKFQEVTKQRDTLAEALRKCREDSIINHDRMKKCGYTQAAIYCQENADRAYKALAAVKGGKQ
jgi:hypothetical protein